MRRQTIFLNALANLTAQVVGAAVSFVLAALIISNYGSAANGLVSSVKQVMTHLLLVEAGVGAASVAALYGPLRSADADVVSGILAGTRKFLRRSALVYTIALVVVSFGFWVWVPSVRGVGNSAYLLLAIGAAGAWELFAVGTHRVTCLASNRAYFVTFIEAGLTAAGGVLAVALVVAGTDLVIVFALVALTTGCKWFFMAGSVRRRFPWIDAHASPDFASISARWSALVHQVTSAVIFSSPVIILAAFTSLIEVSVFTLYYMVMAGVISLVGVFANGLAHGFGVSLNTDRRGTLRAFRAYEFGAYPVIFVGFGTAAVLFIPFVDLYSIHFTDAVYVRPMLAAGFVAAGLLNALRVPANLIVIAAGHFRQTRSRALIEMGLNLGLMLALTASLGIMAFVVSGIVSFGFRSIDFILYANRRVLLSSAWPSFVLILRNGLAVAIGCSICFIVPHPPLDNYVALLLYGGSVVLVLGVCAAGMNAAFDGRRLIHLFGLSGGDQ